MAKPQLGDPAPDVNILDVRGRPVALSSFWKDAPAVAVFLRHYG